MKHLLLVAAPLLLATPSLAAPKVVTDIAPLHSLVARVMEGVGEPALLLASGGTPHDYALRPSESALLQDADLLIWIGPELTPWLGRAREALAQDAVSIPLLAAAETRTLPFREGARFAPHDHGGEHADDHSDEHHDDHGDDNDHDHDKAADDHHDHAHGAVDPHAWLDPMNAHDWLPGIAEALAALDPANAGAYRANALAGQAEIDALVAEISATLDPARGRSFVVFHDAYHYFEARFDIEAAGAVALSDASDPGAARIAEVRATIAELGVACVFAEPQFPGKLIETVLDGTDAREGRLDPVGMGLEPGPALYPQLLRDLATGLTDCLGAAG